MSGYIGSKTSVTLVDGYTQAEADAEFVAKAGDSMTGDLDVTGTVTATEFAGDGSALTGVGSTDYKAVGTYVVAYVNMYALSRTVLGGETFAGSALYGATRTNSSTSYIYPFDGIEGPSYKQSMGASGTWRIMHHKSRTTLSTSPYVAALLVRIS